MEIHALCCIAERLTHHTHTPTIFNQRRAIMVKFSSFIVALSAIAGSFASTVGPAKEIAKRAAPDFTLGPHNDVRRRQATDYTQDYTTGGDVSFSPNSNSFSATFDSSQDFVVGRGWRTGDTT
jgi:endo-1,4-beta-xylanase